MIAPRLRPSTVLAVLLIANSVLAGEPVDVSFKAKHDGTDQRYVVILPDEFDAEKPHSVLIALHGHGSDRWQFVKDKRDECRAARDVAAKHKLIYVSPDYRAKTSWMGPAAEADIVQIIAELKAKYRVDKVIVSGGSMGGTAALTFAALHPDLVDGVVSMNGTANLVEYEQFQDAIAASFGGVRSANHRRAFCGGLASLLMVGQWERRPDRGARRREVDAGDRRGSLLGSAPAGS